MTVFKRNGQDVAFDKGKIVNAIIKANNTVCDAQKLTSEQIGAITDSVVSDCALLEKHDEKITIDKIQEFVENHLMDSGCHNVAKNYITYRRKRDIAREARSEYLDAISEKLEAKNVENQNANIDEHSFTGRVGEASRVMTKQYALDNLLSDLARERHLNNEIYTHDLDNYALGNHNCLSVPIDDLLAKGFRVRQCGIRPAGSINTAMQIVAVIFQLQSQQQFGGVSATHLDWSMVPYFRKSFFKHYKDGLKYIENMNDKKVAELIGDVTKEDAKEISVENEEFYSNAKARKYAFDMTVRETHQAVEALYHNLNSLQSRSGGQVPFSSINYGTCTLPEGRIVTKEILNVSIEGLGPLHQTSVFPCGIFQCMKGVNRKPGDANYDLFRLALRSTAQRLYPNYCNVDWSVNAGYDKNDPSQYVSTMGCRTYNGFDINGMGYKKDGRGNIAPVTIILPTIAMEAKEFCEKYHLTDTPQIFLDFLDTKIHEAKEILIERYKWICSQNPASASFMYGNNTMAGYNPEEGIESAMKHGTLVIGQLGLAETLQILVGCDHTEETGMALAKRIEKLFNTRCKEFKEKEKLNFGVYYTPAENLCFTAMKKFQAKYGKLPNISENEFFTNSMHVPVWKKMSPFEKIDIEAELTGYSNAGCITYVELDSSAKNNIDALEEIVNYAMDKDIPYFAINVPNDTCMECGYTDDINENCPQCGSTNIQRLRRVTGYLTSDYKTAFNFGKQQEVEKRVKHSDSMPSWKSCSDS